MDRCADRSASLNPFPQGISGDRAWRIFGGIFDDGSFLWSTGSVVCIICIRKRQKKSKNVPERKRKEGVI